MTRESDNKRITLIDVTLRDAHQCLWATRMTTAMMRETAPLLDRAGFEAIDLVGGAVFDVCVRYLREDPWERMRILSSWVTETPLIVHHRGQSLFTFELFPDDVVTLTAERIAANGIRYHTTYDALNDIRNLEVPITAAKGAGLHVVGGIVDEAALLEAVANKPRGSQFDAVPFATTASGHSNVPIISGPPIRSIGG